MLTTAPTMGLAAPARTSYAEVGLGYASAPIVGATAAALWEAMQLKVGARIVEFLPVVDVEVEDGGGFVRRSMRFVGDGPMKGKTLRQHIYVDAASHEIRFVGEEVEGQEAPIEVVNALRLEPHLSIEYYQRDRLTGERVHWKAPRARTIAAIERTIALARSAGEVAGEAEGAAE